MSNDVFALLVLVALLGMTVAVNRLDQSRRAGFDQHVDAAMNLANGGGQR